VLGQLRFVESRRYLHQRTQTLMALALATHLEVVAIVRLGQIDTGALGERACSLREGQAVESHQKSQRVTRLLATETMKELSVAPHMK